MEKVSQRRRLQLEYSREMMNTDGNERSFFKKKSRKFCHQAAEKVVVSQKL